VVSLLYAPSGVLAASAVLLGARAALTFRANMGALAASRSDALTDALTGLGNRRRLMADLEERLEDESAAPLALILFDLDGFKLYNDTFGHPAGDALLARLGQSLARATGERGTAYRLGGDEFCALIAPEARGAGETATAVAAALADAGQAFEVTASHGAVLIPSEGRTPEQALHLADERLYAEKSVRHLSAAAQQTSDALVQALHEREPELREHLDGVAALAREVGRVLDLPDDHIDVVVRAAELHDVGKVAVPDAILAKPTPLDEVEWGFVRQHTVVGERILAAAPALVPVARVVRSSHEHYDGAGYPDGLAGDDIPLGARIVAVCDAYHAMTSERPYGRAISHADALAELRDCAGSQFDPRVVEAFCGVAGRLRGHAPSAPARVAQEIA